MISATSGERHIGHFGESDICTRVSLDDDTPGDGPEPGRHAAVILVTEFDREAAPGSCASQSRGRWSVAIAIPVARSTTPTVVSAIQRPGASGWATGPSPPVIATENQPDLSDHGETRQ